VSAARQSHAALPIEVAAFGGSTSIGYSPSDDRSERGAAKATPRRRSQPLLGSTMLFVGQNRLSANDVTRTQNDDDQDDPEPGRDAIVLSAPGYFRRGLA
jgi:hypothetical protein